MVVEFGKHQIIVTVLKYKLSYNIFKVYIYLKFHGNKYSHYEAGTVQNSGILSDLHLQNFLIFIFNVNKTCETIMLRRHRTFKNILIVILFTNIEVILNYKANYTELAL